MSAYCPSEPRTGYLEFEGTNHTKYEAYLFFVLSKSAFFFLENTFIYCICHCQVLAALLYVNMDEDDDSDISFLKFRLTFHC